MEMRSPIPKPKIIFRLTNDKSSSTETSRSKHHKTGAEFFIFTLSLPLDVKINTTKEIYSKPAGKVVRTLLIDYVEGQDWTGTVIVQNFIEKSIAAIFL